jgi:hypothetical protein
MSIVLAALAVAFAAFCVWLTARIFNSRERWAKWTLAAAVGVPVLYVLSFGAVIWLSNDGIIPPTTITSAYPGLWQVLMRGPQPYRRWLRWYVNLPESRQGAMDGIKAELDRKTHFGSD